MEILVILLSAFIVWFIVKVLTAGGTGYSHGRLAGKVGRNLGKAIGGRGSRRFRH